MKGQPIELRGVSVSYGRLRVLEDIDLSVEAGEFIALLGPSGCGKTTLLRALAGFIPLASGRILVGGRDVAGRPPERRGIAMVFQSYALWPHMTAGQNIAYGLRVRRFGRTATARRVEEMTQLVGLEGLEERRVTELSGGQRQRVALARALAIDPPILLLDEPLSNLDARIRHSMRHEIRALQTRLGITAALVTHDQEEAMSMADRVVILHRGRIEQIGAPEEVYHRPATAYVAGFVGATNRLLVVARRDGGEVLLSLAGRPDPVRLPLADGDARPGVHAPGLVGGPMTLRFHGEAAILGSAEGVSDADLAVRGVVRQRSYLGKIYRHHVVVGEHEILVDHPRRVRVGESVDVRIPAAALNLYPESADRAAEGEPGGSTARQETQE